MPYNYRNKTTSHNAMYAITIIHQTRLLTSYSPFLKLDCSNKIHMNI